MGCQLVSLAEEGARWCTFFIQCTRTAHPEQTRARVNDTSKPPPPPPPQPLHPHPPPSPSPPPPPPRKGFRGGPLLDFDGTKQLLFFSHLRERDKMLLRSILSGEQRVVGTDSYLEKPKMMFLASFVGVLMLMVICFGSVPSLPLSRFVGIQSSPRL